MEINTGILMGVGLFPEGQEALRAIHLERFLALKLRNIFAKKDCDLKPFVKREKPKQTVVESERKEFSFFSFLKKKPKPEPKPKYMYETIMESSVLCSIFEFIDTVELINVVAFVSPQFHDLIIYNQQAGNQIYGGRILYFSKKNNISMNCKELTQLRKLHHTNSWIELYLLSGMIFLEYYKDAICQAALSFNPTNNPMSFQENYLIFDPTMLIENQTILDLIEGKRKKLISISKDEAQNIPRKITNAIPFTDSEDLFLKSVLFSPLLSSSINFEKGLPLYLRFLKDITNKLKGAKLYKQKEGYIREFQYISSKIMEKTKYFLQESKSNYFDFAPDDVLLGLHFILLDNYYEIERLYLGNLVYLNFTEFLENRANLNDLNLNKCKFPIDLQADFLQVLSSGENIEIPSNHWFSPKLFFKNSKRIRNMDQQVDCLKLFIKEHIFDLSKTKISPKDEYTQFLKDPEKTSPKKQVDLYFHFHMLHSIFFYQECRGISQFIKSHELCF